MPNSVTSTRLKKFTSIARNAAVSVAGVGSADVISVVHGLGRSPDIAYAIPRTIRASVSQNIPPILFIGANASIATFSAPPAGAWDGLVDFVCQYVHSVGR